MTANHSQRTTRWPQGVGLDVVLKGRSVYSTDPIRKSLIAMSNTIHIVTSTTSSIEVAVRRTQCSLQYQHCTYCTEITRTSEEHQHLESPAENQEVQGNTRRSVVLTKGGLEIEKGGWFCLPMPIIIRSRARGAVIPGRRLPGR